MGMGNKFTLKIGKDDENNPGPGQYNKINLNSIENSLCKKPLMPNDKLVFGCSKE